MSEATIRALREEIATCLGLTSDSIDIHANLLDLGLDSLRLIELLSRLEKRFAVEMTIEDFFHGPTIETLAAVMSETHNIR